MNKKQQIEKGYKDGLVSRVINQNSGKKYVISTAQEIGRGYWSTSIMKSKFFGLWTDFHHRLTIIRNNKEDAYNVHEIIIKIAETTPEKDWLEAFPSPKPTEGYSEEAKEVLRKTGLMNE